MFTGIVQTRATVHLLESAPAGRRLVVDVGPWRPVGRAVAGGDSICISGVCLTVVDVDGPLISFDVIAETLACTTLGDLAAGDVVNIEPSLTADTPMSGHFVQGHVEAVGRVTQIHNVRDDMRMTIRPPAPGEGDESLMRYIIPKGSVAVDGVSMTVAAVTRDDFTIALIPTTLELTTLGRIVSDNDTAARVNLETDIISRTVVHTLHQTGAGNADQSVSMDLLKQAGFV